MPKKASVKFRSLRSNLVHLPLSLYASLTQQQTRPQGLLLHLTPIVASSSRAQIAYLGWSGLASASSLAGGIGGEETIEVDPEVGMSLGWTEGMLLEIVIIHNPTKARNVTVTPLSSDDWEILEQHASFLENNLLTQLRAAQKGRIIDVWVNRTKIRIKVDDTDPRTGETSAVLLHPGTEVYVAPRPRNTVSSTSHAQSNGSSSTRLSSPPGVAKLTDGLDKGKGKAKERSVTMRCIPGRVAATWGQPDLPNEFVIGSLEKVLLCSSESLRVVKRRLDVKSDDKAYVHVTLKRSTPRATDVEAGVEVNKEAVEEVDSLEAWLIPWDEVPSGCLVMEGVSPGKCADWRKVRITSAMPPKGRLKGASTSRNATLPSMAKETGHELPGTKQVIENAISYISRNATRTARPLLLTGGKGSGKTSIAKIIGTRLERDRAVLAETILEDVARLDIDRFKEVKEKMASWIRDTATKSPCLLILDGLDLLLSPETELSSAGSSNPTLLAEHFVRLFQTVPPGVQVLATANSLASLHPLLNTKHIFGETIKLPPMTKEVRQDVLAFHLQGVTSNLPQQTLDYVTLASQTEGYSASDLKDLADAARQQAIIRASKSEDEPYLGMEDFVTAQAAFTPISLRGVSLQKSTVAWSDIGGLHEPRRILRETLEWPTKYAQIFASSPLRLRSGLLLYGYPGCGKTLLASAVAKECGLNFIAVKGPEILNKYIGASEKAVRDLFERASAAKPCVLFFDEFDSIAPKRGHDSTGVTDRVVNQMLTEMDGAQGLEGVYVLAATSRPDLIDSALLRPGRLDKSLLCDMPNASERLEILEAVSRKLAFGADIDLGAIANDTEGLSGADLQAIIYNAHLEVVHSSISNAESSVNGQMGTKSKARAGMTNGEGKFEEGVNYRQLVPEDKAETKIERAAMNARIGHILDNTHQAGQMEDKVRLGSTERSKHHLIKALESTRPSVSPKDRARLERIYRAFVSERDGKVSDGNLGNETGTRASLM